jgi:hypothetical protein
MVLRSLHDESATSNLNDVPGKRPRFSEWGLSTTSSENDDSLSAQADSSPLLTDILYGNFWSLRRGLSSLSLFLGTRARKLSIVTGAYNRLFQRVNGVGRWLW